MKETEKINSIIQKKRKIKTEDIENFKKENENLERFKLKEDEIKLIIKIKQETVEIIEQIKSNGNNEILNLEKNKINLIDSLIILKFNHSLLKLKSKYHLILFFKFILSNIYLEILLNLNHFLNQNQNKNQIGIENKPKLGSKDLKTLHILGKTISNYSIFNQINQRDDDEIISTHFPFFSFHQTIISLTEIILPNQLFNSKFKTDSNYFNNPEFELHHALFSTLNLSLMAGLIKLKLNPIHSHWAKLHLDLLFNLTNSNLIFSSLLSIYNSLNHSNQEIQNSPQQEYSSKFKSEISSILSIQLLRPSGLISLLNSLILQDYQEDDHIHHDENLSKNLVSHSNITSATLKRFESIYYILSHPPSSISSSTYWDNILRNLIQIITPEFFLEKNHSNSNQPPPQQNFNTIPDSIRKAACFILSQIVCRQPLVFRKYLSPLIHSALRPPSPENSNEEPSKKEEDKIVVSSFKLNQTIQIINQLILNSDPSQLLIDRLLLPILPQLLSLVLFSLRTKSDPILRQSTQNLIQIWIQMNSTSTQSPQDQNDSTVAEWIRCTIRELEIGKELNLYLRHHREKEFLSSSKLNRWARDDDGSCCIKLANASTDHQLDNPFIEFSIDIEALLEWLKSLNVNNLNFIGILLAKWLNEIQTLSQQSGFDQVKMTLLRIQVSLKIIENFETSKIIQDPTQILDFVHHSLIINIEKKRKTKEDPKEVDLKSDSKIQTFKKQSMTLESLKFINLNDDQDRDEKEEEEEEDLNEGILVTGLTLLLTIIESNPDLNESNTPILKEISSQLDDILLLDKYNSRSSDKNNENSSKIYELGIQVKLMISIRKALDQVDKLSHDHNHGEEKVEKEIESLENQFIEGLKLIENECIPIRSQGISILKQVLLTKNTLKDKKIENLLNSWASQIIPILLRLIEEEDSFIYLNSIKALSSLAEKYHNLVCVRLNLGFSGVQVNDLDQEDNQKNSLDRRLRIGEAIAQVIQRAGSALPVYINKLLPSLLIVLSCVPKEDQNEKDIIKLKASTLSILTTCVESSFLTMLPYLSDLIQSCLTILNSSSSMMTTKQEEDEPEEEEEEELLNQKTDPSHNLKVKIKEEDDEDLDSIRFSNDQSYSKDMEKNVKPDDLHHSIYPTTKNQDDKIGSEMNILKRAAMYFIDRLLNQIYQVCSNSSTSSDSDFKFIIKTLRVDLRKDLIDLNRNLKFIHSHSSSTFDRIVFDLLSNALDSLDFIHRFFLSFLN